MNVDLHLSLLRLTLLLFLLSLPPQGLNVLNLWRLHSSTAELLGLDCNSPIVLSSCGLADNALYELGYWLFLVHAHVCRVCLGSWVALADGFCPVPLLLLFWHLVLVYSHSVGDTHGSVGCTGLTFALLCTN